METIILQADTLNLPSVFASKLYGKKVEIIEKDNSIIINPVEYTTKSMRGMFKSDGHAVDRFMAKKKLEKELELHG